MKLYRKIRSWIVRLLYNKDELEIIIFAMVSRRDSYEMSLKRCNEAGDHKSDEFMANKIKMHNYVIHEFCNMWW